MARRSGPRLKAPEWLGILWATIFTFCVGLAVVLPEYPAWLKPDFIILLYIFFEFLPLLIFIFTILQTSLSVYLLLPWIIVNTCLILFSSILVLSLSISHPTKKDVLFCLILSILAVFPIATAIVMSLPAYVFIRRIPKYKKQLHNSELFRQVTKRKTAAEIEAEIKQRRREQVKNTIITDKSYEQFIYVSRAANKWMKKIEKKRSQAQDSPPETMIPEAEMFAEGNVTVNVGYNGLDTVAEETHDTLHSESRIVPDYNKINGDGRKSSSQENGNRVQNGKMVTDV